MTWAELVAEVSRRRRTTKVATAAIARELFAVLAKEALAGGYVLVPGFGAFNRRSRKQRKVRNPATGEPLQLPGQVSVGFRPSKRLRRWR